MSMPVEQLVLESVDIDLEQLLESTPHGMGPLAEKLEIVMVEASSTRLVATMPVIGNQQPYGLLHGGASVALAETLGSLGAGLHAFPNRAAVGIEINASHHASARDGLVTATATALRLGRTLASYEVKIVDEADTLVCTARISCALVERRS